MSMNIQIGVTFSLKIEMFYMRLHDQILISGILLIYI